MRSFKNFVPRAVKHQIVAARKRARYAWRRVVIQRAIHRNKPLKIIIGAAETWQKGWYATNEQWLDITNISHWATVFNGKQLIINAVAEHVFEHLSESECITALKLIGLHMKQGGVLRIAVPDGYNPDTEYLRHVGIAGIGDDAGDHKQLLNADSLTTLLRNAGFEPRIVEGFTSKRELVANPWSADQGFIRRSRQNTPDIKWGFTDASTSLIVDARKP